ncbi:hypothetical protein [Algoriphagus sp.]|uniref:hypothetical protein n=1 Tax=Algoriphagus sp. TaxID=1872435 RepID=UPI00391C7416
MSFFKPYYYLILILVLGAGCRQQEIQYTDFYGNIQDLEYVESKKIRLFYPVKKFNRSELKKLLHTYDTAYLVAARIGGQHPGLDSVYGEKLPIAVVPTTCGSGCGKLGMKGIEFTEEKFKNVVQLFLNSDKHDHIFFYELGRNFWFFESSLTLKDHPENTHIRTGFAIFLRNVLIHELKIEVGNINGVLYSLYMREISEAWEEFTKNNGPNPLHALLVNQDTMERQKPIFWSMYWWSLYELEGFSSKFLEVYFQEVKRQIAPDSVEDLIFNFTDSYEKAKIRY